MSMAMKVEMRRMARAGMYGMPAAGAGGMFRHNRGPRGDQGRQGDFLGLGKALSKFGGFIPGIGPILSAGGALLQGVGKKKKGVRAGKPTSPSVGPGGGIAMAGFGLPSLADIQGLLTPKFRGVTAMAGGLPSLSIPGHSDLARTLGVGSTGMIPKGYRLNKSRYYINDPLIPGSEQGREIEPGSRIVKIRHRNAFNPRAASRAMSRLASLSHGMKALERNLRKMVPRHVVRAAPRRAFGKK